MPSWNIHMAHVERLLVRHEPGELGIRDVNAFLFGNVVPDVYVGYMVKGTTKVIDYGQTHLTPPQHIPEPGHRQFWERCVAPGAGQDDPATDVTLGAWAHLVADATYNHRVKERIAELGLEVDRELRIRKQGDFDLFGHTLELSLAPEVTGELLSQCAAFPQYAIEEPDVRAAVQVACAIVADTRAHHIAGKPAYSLLDAAFFADTFAEVDHLVASGLMRHAAGRSPYEV